MPPQLKHNSHFVWVTVRKKRFQVRQKLLKLRETIRERNIFISAEKKNTSWKMGVKVASSYTFSRTRGTVFCFPSSQQDNCEFLVPAMEQVPPICIILKNELAFRNVHNTQTLITYILFYLVYIFSFNQHYLVNHPATVMS